MLEKTFFALQLLSISTNVECVPAGASPAARMGPIGPESGRSMVGRAGVCAGPIGGRALTPPTLAPSRGCAPLSAPRHRCDNNGAPGGLGAPRPPPRRAAARRNGQTEKCVSMIALSGALE